MRHAATVGMVGWAGWEATKTDWYVVLVVVAYVVGCWMGRRIQRRKQT